MKVVAALLGIAVVAGIGFVLIPRGARGPGQTAVASGIEPEAVRTARQGPVVPGRQIEAPLSKEEEVRLELSDKRLPFFRNLRERFADTVQHFGVTGDPDTLDLVVEKADNETLQYLITQAVSPTGRQYGFRRVRFFTRNPVGSVEPLNLVAESSYNDAGRWDTFRM